MDDTLTDRVVWATKQLLEIDRLRDVGDYRAAFALATEVEPLLTDDATPEDLWAGFSWAVDIETEPSGARVYRQSIVAEEDKWEDLGTTPLRNIRFAFDDGYRLRFELQGHRRVQILGAALYGDESIKFIDVPSDLSRAGLLGVLPSSLAHWLFFQLKRQGTRLQLDTEVLLRFPLPEALRGDPASDLLAHLLRALAFARSLPAK